MTSVDVIARYAEGDKWLAERERKDEKFHFKVRQDGSIPVN